MPGIHDNNIPDDAARLASKLCGVLLPTTTPFNTDGSIDHVGLKKNLSLWNETGVAGYVLLGSTGERAHLDEREYLEVIETARGEVSTSRAFIVGAGQQSTRATINEISRAAAAGADAVLVLTPSYYRSAITQEVLIKHYSAVADASPIQVILYSMPVFTGIKIEPTTIGRLSAHPNIIGVKDSSSDIEGLKQTVELCPSEFAVMTGNGTVLLPALKSGAQGAILAVGCAIPEICLGIFHAFRSGDEERAAVLQEKLAPLAAAVTTKYGIGGLKAALDMNGYIGAKVRAPLQPPDEKAKVEIGELLRSAMISLGSVSTTAK